MSCHPTSSAVRRRTAGRLPWSTCWWLPGRRRSGIRRSSPPPSWTSWVSRRARSASGRRRTLRRSPPEHRSSGGGRIQPARFGASTIRVGGDSMTPEETVRANFDAYLRQDRAACEALLGDELTFTSPQDDHIDKSTFLERCFPTAERVSRQELVHVTRADEHDVFVMYEYDL